MKNKNKNKIYVDKLHALISQEKCLNKVFFFVSVKNFL